MSGQGSDGQKANATEKQLGQSLLDKGGKSAEQVESLLRFLTYLVLSKEQMSPEEYKKTLGGGKTDQTQQPKVTEQTKKSLLELLRSDPNLRETIFGNASE